MSKKNYNGLEVESILFGENDITTGTVGPDDLYYDSGCSVSTISIYTSDNEGNPMPLGTCYYKSTDELSLTWASPSGGFA